MSLFGLIGFPVAHSVSPAIHGAAYLMLEQQHRYELFPCENEEAVEKVFSRLRAGEIAGVNVTVPHKQLAIRMCDELDTSASSTGAVNVVRPLPDGRLRGYNTDASALKKEIATLAESENAKSDTSCLILGNGGASLAAIAAAKQFGFSKIYVSARRFDSEQAMSAWPSAERLSALGVELVAWPPSAVFNEEDDFISLVIQATTDGMHGASDGSSVLDATPWKMLHPEAVIYDVVYNPDITPIVRAALSKGYRAKTGMGMLVGQAADAIEIWLGEGVQIKADARVELLKAAKEALHRRASGSTLAANDQGVKS